ncbi:MAG TPA: M28 family peptidase [Longimicrobium sp.]|jgi:hypothetical protein
MSGGRRALALLCLAALAACGERRAERPDFPPDLAWSFLVQQVAFGPRYAGHRGHEAELAWLAEQMGMRADSVVLQPFTDTVADGGAVKLANVLARWHPDSANRVLLVAHWDTRRRAESSRDSLDRRRPVPGANDGAAPTAVLVALAELFKQQPPPVGVDLLLADGDDFGPGADDLYLGTRRYLASLQGPKPRYAVVLDLVGERNAKFPREGASLRAAPRLVDRVWTIARQLDLDTVFVADSVPPVPDERVRLLGAAGIPAVLVTDPQYGAANRFQHSVDDVVALLDRETLWAVGEVLAEVVYRGMPEERR